MRVEFTEEMSGFYNPGAPAYDTGFVVGRRDWNHLGFRLTIGTDDVKKFLADPDHEMWAKGIVRCPEFNAADVPIDAEQSSFNLFTRAGRGRYLMKYRLVFTTPSGDPMTLLGFKDVGDDWGFDAWTDTTTLFTRLVRGIADEDAAMDDEHGRGILRLDAPMFARQLTTFRGTPLGVGRFGLFFLGRLIDAYPGPFARRPR